MNPNGARRDGRVAVDDPARQFKVDLAIIGVSAIDGDGALLDYDYQEVKVAQAILTNARKVVLVSESSKFRRPRRCGSAISARSTYS